MTEALGAYQQSGESLARYLFNRGLATEDDLVRGMASEVGLDFVDLSTFPLDQRAASLLPESVARHHMVLPVRIEDGVPLVAMANPSDVYAMDDLRTIMGRNFTPVVATRSQIATQIRLAYEGDVDMSGLAEDAADDMAGAGAGFELESLQSVVEDAPIVRYVNLLILQALNERASDIHIEPTPRRLRIRFRIDGVMQDATSASASIHPAVVSRLKVLGEMDIAEHRIPQEGRVSLTVGDRQIDLRLATLPSMFGETCVMRLLDKSASIRGLPELGFFPDTLDRYAQAYRHPYGVILVTGPTGAGKTTTVYGTLQEVMTKEKSVVTVEDPVEYQIDGITQVQINQKAGLDFARALRSILRSDPDIVLIGEVRDTPTATIAMEAALSGHLVLTTLHTNTAAATPLRLTEMGIEPFLVTSSITGILTQRLARVLCKQCKEPYVASEKDFIAAGYKESDLDRCRHHHALPSGGVPVVQPHRVPRPDGPGRGAHHDRGDRSHDHRAAADGQHRARGLRPGDADAPHGRPAEGGRRADDAPRSAPGGHLTGPAPACVAGRTESGPRLRALDVSPLRWRPPSTTRSATRRAT